MVNLLFLLVGIIIGRMSTLKGYIGCDEKKYKISDWGILITPCGDEHHHIIADQTEKHQ